MQSGQAARCGYFIDISPLNTKVGLDGATQNSTISYGIINVSSMLYKINRTILHRMHDKASVLYFP